MRKGRAWIRRHAQGAKARIRYDGMRPKAKALGYLDDLLEANVIGIPRNRKAAEWAAFACVACGLVGLFAGDAGGRKFIALVPLDGVGSVEDLPAEVDAEAG